MNEAEAAGSTDDAAAIGFSVLAAGVEDAIAAAQAEIAAMARAVQHGFGALRPALPPAPIEAGPRPAAQDEPGSAQTAAAPVAARQAPAIAAPHREPRREPRRASDADHARPMVAHAAPPAPAAPCAAAPAMPVFPPPPMISEQAQTAPAPANSLPVAAPTEAAGVSPPALNLLLAAPAAPPALRAWSPQAGGEAPPEPMGAAALAAPFAPFGDAPSTVAPSPQAGVRERSSAGAGQHRRHEQHAASQPLALHGDVFLDGVRVGQWMSDMLARAAGGPATGSTAFDPRLGPRWPGALQGQ